MKHFVLFLLLFMPFSALASEKHDINTPFFDEKYYEEEKDKLEKEKIFKNLDFLYKEKKTALTCISKPKNAPIFCLCFLLLTAQNARAEYPF